MTNSTKWTPNEKQAKVLALLKTAKKPMTLAEISKELGIEIKSGTTNTLITKKLMTSQDIDIACNIVAVESGEIVGHTTKHVKAYTLAE